mmetsp:Transcript_44638/g.129050  ORF Transcript_44638/g.129050 Transcript_44638/m.129050 type:complete len:315 (+) Transcript_44638:43-987(+)
MPRVIVGVLAGLFFLGDCTRRSQLHLAQPASKASRRRLKHLILLAVSGASAGTTLEVATLDENSDGVVDLGEFMLSTRDALSWSDDKAYRRTVYEIARGMYKAGDIDGDGVLNAEEMEYIVRLSWEAGGNGKMFPVGAEHLREVAEYDFGVSKYEAMLRDLDADGDGLIDAEEWRSSAADAMALRGMPWAFRDDKQFVQLAEAIAHRADITADGFLDHRELHFASFLTSETLDKIEEVASFLLSLLDSDGDGALGWQEVADEGFRTMSKPGGKLTPAQRIGTLFFDLDLNEDKRLTKRELFVVGLKVVADSQHP